MVSRYTEYFQRAKRIAKLWFIVIRPMFLLGSIALTILGTSIAWWDGYFALGYTILTFVGLLLWHMSVNVLNDYYDFRSGIDFKTRRTPFSGGSGILTSSLLGAESVFKFGLILFVLALPIWIYFLVARGVLLLPILTAGAFCVLLYTPILTKRRLAEISSSIGIGILPILAFYFIQTGGYSLDVCIVALASGILMFNVHLLNEFPDVEADITGNRKNLPIILSRKKTSWFYLASTVAFYIWILTWTIAGVIPLLTLLSIVTLPIAIWVTKNTFNYREQASFIPTLWAGAIIYFLTMVLLALGYIIDGLSLSV